MSSPDLLLKQAERWLNNRKHKIAGSSIDLNSTKEELTKLKAQEERYAKAYGQGVISMEQLREYSLPIKEKISSLETQIVKAEEEVKTDAPIFFEKSEIESFALSVSKGIHNLSFEVKQGIIRNTVEKVIATRQEMQIYGHIPIKQSSNDEFIPNHRHGKDTIQHPCAKAIPFHIKIALKTYGYRVNR